MVSVYLTYIVISIEQVKIEDKSNEIKAIAKLLEILDVEGYMIKEHTHDKEEKNIYKN